MSNILAFRVLPGHRSARVEGVLAHPAEVVIFPGIRYERAGPPVEPTPAPTAHNGGGRRPRRGAK